MAIRRKSSPRRSTVSPLLLKGRTVGVIGLGQVGGSIVQSLGRYRPTLTVYGYDVNSVLARRARTHCRWAQSIRDIVGASDLLILAAPVPAILRLLPIVAAEARGHRAGKRLTVLDTGTVKAAPMRVAARYKGLFDFVGLHPLAGNERRGWDAATPDLFLDRRIVYCTTAPRSRCVAHARELITLLGGTAIKMDAQEHDRFAALAIGLPHVLAFAADGLANAPKRGNPLRGGSWESLTRVAASEPTMVAGFLSANVREQTRILRRFGRRLDGLIRALENQSAAELTKTLEHLARR
ncbi:MAG: prephenate dehydrogenase/arogenate dehydrogenase family protein [candidate division Zixibacteria bacterium]|nr:prephenate dehydrogenase/arogenate dehydrogenase family protein [candidate division Zixibacteria bacterium]